MADLTERLRIRGDETMQTRSKIRAATRQIWATVRAGATVDVLQNSTAFNELMRMGTGKE